MNQDVKNKNMMKPEEINTVDDMQDFVEGCVNDLEAGIACKEETINHLKDYTFRVIELTAKQFNK